MAHALSQRPAQNGCLWANGPVAEVAMDGDQQSREALEAEAKLRFAGAMLTGCVWPLLKGAIYGMGIIGMLVGLGRLITGH